MIFKTLKIILQNSETCDPKNAAITDGTIVSGEKSRYVYGDKVVYQCNANFVLEGNNYIMCMGSEFNSLVPTCKGLVYKIYSIYLKCCIYPDRDKILKILWS